MTLEYNPRKPMLILLAGLWWCYRCGAGGFLPGRPRHEPGCKRRRPITWSPPKMLVEESYAKT